MRTVKKVLIIFSIIGFTVLLGELAEIVNQPPNMVVAFGNIETVVDESYTLREVRHYANSAEIDLRKEPPNCYVEVVREEQEGRLEWACDDGRGNITWKEAQERGQKADIESLVNINTKHYSWEHGGGNVLQFVDSSGGCSGGSAYYAPDLGAFGWDNQVSSTQSLGNCGRVTLYEHTNRGGPSITCTPYCGKLYSMNNVASSSYTEN